MCKSHATRRALITCNMSCYVPLGTKGQLSYYVVSSVWHRGKNAGFEQEMHIVFAMYTTRNPICMLSCIDVK